MLDDKNDTIEQMKAEIDSLKSEQEREQEGKVDIADFEKLNIKYRKGKDKLKEL